MITTRKGRALVFMACVLLLASCGSPDDWPTKGWRTSTPEEQGIDSEQLIAMLQESQERSYALDSIMVVRNGHIVMDVYVFPFKEVSRHIIHSCAKSVLSILIGIAIDRGEIEGVDQPVLDYFPELDVAHLDADKRAMTIEDLLTMRSGLNCQDSYLYRWVGLDDMRRSDNWAKYVLDLPMREAPGTRFEYCNGASHLLSTILYRATGMTALDYARQHLFGPLGIRDVYWPASPEGITFGWGQLSMRTHDMAKIGYLYLYEGKWEGQRIVSSSWVQASTRSHTPATLYDGYGYQWWVEADGIYMAMGYAGQHIMVVPDKEMIVVITGTFHEDRFDVPERLLRRYILPAAASPKPLPENPDAVKRLREMSADLIEL